MNPIVYLTTGLRSGDWLHRRRLMGYAWIVLVAEVAVFIFLVLGTHGLIVPMKGGLSTDFGSFYAAGALADAGTPALAYDKAAHYLAEQRSSGQWGAVYNFFFYPPVFILLCQILARLPYLTAFVAFQIAAGLFYIVAIRRIIGRAAPWLPFIVFPAVLQSIGLGQNALLTAAIFGAATLAVDQRPGQAGILFGLLCYKPHFGLLVAVALVSGRHWRCLAAAAATTVALIGLSLLLHGVETWRAFLHVAASAPGIFDAGRVRQSGLINVFGGLRLLGVPSGIAAGAQVAVSLAAAVAVAFAWAWRGSLPARAMVLISASLLALPVILFYDFLLAAIAIAWAVRDARDTGFLPWEKAAYMLVALIALLGRSLAEGLDLPLYPLASAIMLGYALRRCRPVAVPMGAS